VACAGYSQQQFGAFNKWSWAFSEANRPYTQSQIIKTTFKPKFNLPVLPSYQGKFPQDFWDKIKKQVREQNITGGLAPMLFSVLGVGRIMR
jgi:hypothetical protein